MSFFPPTTGYAPPPPFRRTRARLWYWYLCAIRLIPRLVWVGQEIDVVVTFTEDKLHQTDGVERLFYGELPEIRRRLAGIGVEFDSGIGPKGHDWEWDFSLRGPISVRFRGRASRPERRLGR